MSSELQNYLWRRPGSRCHATIDQRGSLCTVESKYTACRLFITKLPHSTPTHRPRPAQSLLARVSLTLGIADSLINRQNYTCRLNCRALEQSENTHIAKHIKACRFETTRRISIQVQLLECTHNRVLFDVRWFPDKGLMRVADAVVYNVDAKMLATGRMFLPQLVKDIR